MWKPESRETMPDHASTDVLVSVKELEVHFPIMRGMIWSRQVGAIKAVDGVSFDIRRGETLGLVGESGCGKSTTGRAILQLYKPTAGKVYFGDVELTELSQTQLRPLRPQLQMIFQDSYASLNPRHSVGKIIAEPLVIHRQADERTAKARVSELLDLVGLTDVAHKLPSSTSGGQQQLAAIARALANDPPILAADEPTGNLDSATAEIIFQLFNQLVDQGKTIIMVTHDPDKAERVSRVVTIADGEIIQEAQIAAAQRT